MQEYFLFKQKIRVFMEDCIHSFKTYRKAQDIQRKSGIPPKVDPDKSKATQG